MLQITRFERERWARLARAGLLVAVWLGLGLVSVVLSLMLWTEPSAIVLLIGSPMLLPVPWIVVRANARGQIRVFRDAVEIRHRRVLRRPLIVPRAQVERVLLDDGSATGRARFPTGDEREPLLWTDAIPSRQHDDRPLIGDSVLPNLALVLREPLPMDAARGRLAAVADGCEMAPPRPEGHARALLLAMDDLDAAAVAFAGWPIERPDVRHVIPPEVAEAAARAPKDANLFLALAAVGAMLVTAKLFVLVPVWFAVSAVVLHRMIGRRRQAGDTARADVARRAASLSPADRAAALAAIDTNLGSAAESFGPPPP